MKTLGSFGTVLLFVGGAFSIPSSGRRLSKTGISSPLPIVDLGYAIHQATLNDSSFSYYNFSNIRYASPPLGDLRFSAPVPPNSTNRTINDGQTGVICPQGNPDWGQIAALFLSGVSLPQLENFTVNSTIPTPDPRQSEDCLFLDVFVPTPIFNANGTSHTSNHGYGRRSGNNSNASSGAAVMVWIYGGGYTSGDKAGSGDPAGLLAQSQQNGQEGVIYVAMNYRLGLFGWQSGPTFQESGTANAGLWDQRLALEWVQTYIHLFGGDPDRVTLFGESAGGGSVMHQITAFGGLEGKVPFQQAIPQSPGFVPTPGAAQQEATFQSILGNATALFGQNITSLCSLRSLSTSQLQFLNSLLIANSFPYGTFTFDPTVDGHFVTALPGVLLAHGQFDKSLKVMIGHNSDEGLLFTSPFIQTEPELENYISITLPDASNITKNFILNTLYPPIFDGSQPYTNPTTRLALLTSELSFTCNTRYLDLAFENQTFSYLFAIPPGIHGQDVAYTYFNGDTSTSDDGLPVIPEIALGFQTYLTSFAMNGNPNTQDLPEFPVYGDEAQILVVNVTGFSTAGDTVANDRCDFWQKALYF